jgi:hypothetical protein
MNSRITLLLGLYCCASLACRSNAPVVENYEFSSIDTPVRQVIDSVIPIEEALRQFQADIPEPITNFSHGAPSKDALVRKFIEGIAQRDTASLARLTMSRAEFAYLYYPNHPQSKPPYELPPQLMWFQMTVNSEKGLRRALRDFGGRQLQARYTCADSAKIQNENRVWTRCVIELPQSQEAEGAKAIALFSAIIERQGVYKFLSYSNSL